MIDLYTYGTPNGWRASIMLEETGLEYSVHKVDLMAGQQSQPEYLQINPTGRIPAIVDHDAEEGEALVLSQSAAILLYLAEKTGRLLPANPAAKASVLEWLLFHAADITPTGFNAFYLSSRVKPAHPEAAKVLLQRNLDFYRYFDQRLADHEYLAGDSYSIADIAALPAVVSRQEVLFERYPHIHRWCDALLARPAVQRGLKIPD